MLVILGCSDGRRYVASKPIVVGIASVPWRETTCELAVRSLIKQVDKIHLYLNGYDSVPDFTTGACPYIKKDDLKKIVVHRSQDYGDLGSSGKWFGSQYYQQCRYFSCDDDILYPADYVMKMISKLERHGRCIVCVHGANLKRPIESYYKSLRTIRFELPLNEDTKVEIPGTGTMLTDTSIFRPKVQEANYDDPQTAAKALKEGIPIYAIQRPERWLTNIDTAYRKSIYGRKAEIDAKVTAFVKEHLEHKNSLPLLKSVIAELKPCRWRGNAVADRFECHSSKFVKRSGKANLVSIDICHKCPWPNHEPSPEEAYDEKIKAAMSTSTSTPTKPCGGCTGAES